MKKHRNFRIENETWYALSRIAELRRERTSEVMRELAEGYVKRHRALIANDPVWHATLAKLREDEAREAAELKAQRAGEASNG